MLLNAFQSGSQLGLHQLVADLYTEKDSFRIRKLRELSNRRVAVQGLAQAVGDWKSIRSQPDGGFQQLRPTFVPIFLVCQLESANRSGNARSAPPELAVHGDVSVCIQIHVPRGGERSLFAEVDKGGSTVGETGQHEAASADIAGRRMRDGERESNSHGCVDGVTAGLEHRSAHISGQRLLRNHHGMAGVDRLPGVHQRREEQGADNRANSH